jgi:hypothetical protein
MPRLAYADPLRAWLVSFEGTGPWQTINESEVPLSDLRFADFDGDGKADVFTTWGGKWRVSFAGTTPWQEINTSNVEVGDLKFGRFAVCQNTSIDVFTTWGGKWRVSCGGTGNWNVINTSSVEVANIRFGTFAVCGNTKTDVFTTWGGKWRVSCGGTGNWNVINTSSVEVSDLRFGRFPDKCTNTKTDVFTTWGGKWRVSCGGTSDWKVLNTSSLGIAELALGDFNGDGKTDIFAAWGGKWRVSFGGVSDWQEINSSDIGVADLAFADFSGKDAKRKSKTDVFRTAEIQFVPLFISRFTRATLDNATADAILTNARQVLLTNDGPGDQVCLVGFTRFGDVETFTEGDGSIDSTADLYAVGTTALIGGVRVVNQINFCNGKIVLSAVGCSPTPGNFLVVVRTTPNLEGALWVHEYGHTRGLKHPKPPDINAVMDLGLSLTTRRVNSKECDAYHEE